VHAGGGDVPYVRADRGISIPAGAIVVADSANIAIHLGDGIGVTCIERERRGKLGRIENSHITKANAGHSVTSTFSDGDHEIHTIILNGHALYAGSCAEISTVTVVIENAVDIFIQLGAINTSGFGEKGEPALLLGLHLVAQHMRLEGGVALEADIAYFSAGTLVDDQDKFS